MTESQAKQVWDEAWETARSYLNCSEEWRYSNARTDALQSDYCEDARQMVPSASASTLTDLRGILVRRHGEDARIAALKMLDKIIAAQPASPADHSGDSADMVASICTCPSGNGSLAPCPVHPRTTTVCQGMNCGATDGKSHSDECVAEHDATVTLSKLIKSAQAGEGSGDTCRREGWNDAIRAAIKALALAASPAAPTVPGGFLIKRVEGHGWIIDPPAGSRWIAHEGTPAGDFIAALLAASPAQVEDARASRRGVALSDEEDKEEAPALLVEWDKFPAWLIDHNEGDTITEELLQHALADMLKAHPARASSSQQGVALSEWPMQSGTGAANFEAIKSNPDDQHSPWLLRMPGTTACLLFNHEADDSIDEARCKYVAMACNRASSSRAEVEKDAERYRFLCAHPDWKFIEDVCRSFVAESEREFYQGLSLAIDALRTRGSK